MLGRLRKVPVDEMFGTGGGDFTVWLQQNVDVVNESIDLRLSGVRDEGSGSAADVVAYDGSGNAIVIQNFFGGEIDTTLGKLVRGMAGADAATGVMVVPHSHPEHTSVVTWLNEKTAFDFYLLQVEAYRIDDSVPAPVLTLVSGPSGAASQPESSLRDLPEEEAVLVAPVPDAPEETYGEGDDGAGQGTYVSGDPSVDEAPGTNGLGTESSTGDPVLVTETSVDDPEGLASSASETPSEETVSVSSFEDYVAAEDSEAEGSASGNVAVEQVGLVEEAPADEASEDTSEELAQWYWGELLSKAEQRTRIHADVAPPGDRVASASAGLAGLDYNYVIGDHDASVELYINRGEGRESENETIFNALQATQDAIEYNFGGPLDWQREPDAKSGLRITSRVEEAGLRDEGRWSEIQDAMVDAMVRLERAMRPHIARLQI